MDKMVELQAHLEPSQTPDEDAPVRQCHRYLGQRQDHLDYAGAIRQGLPIGSGDFEPREALCWRCAASADRPCHRRRAGRLEAARVADKAQSPSPARYDSRELQGLPAPVQRYFRAVLKEG